MESQDLSTQTSCPSPTTRKQIHQQDRPIPISQRAKSNVETKDAARKGLLQIMMNKFSSTPLQENEYSEKDELKLRNQIYNVDDSGRIDLLQYDASLTKSEREYLRQIIQSGDANSIQSASVILQNEDVFPNAQHLCEASSTTSSESSKSNIAEELSICEDDDDTTDSMDEKKKDDIHHHTHVGVDSIHHHHHHKHHLSKKICTGDSYLEKNHVGTTSISPMTQHRNSTIQQHLFRLHETKDVQPLEIIERISRQNSILMMDDSNGTNNTSFRHFRPMSSILSDGASELQPIASNDNDHEHPSDIHPDVDTVGNTEEGLGDSVAEVVAKVEVDHSIASGDPIPISSEQIVIDETMLDWNPFEDISSWLDGSQGIEVTATESSTTGIVSSSDGSNMDLPLPVPAVRMNQITRNGNMNHSPFRILGTSADDISCHPHVLSPPLMESLLAFVPEYSHGNMEPALPSIAEHRTPIATAPPAESSTNTLRNPCATSPNESGTTPLECTPFRCQRDTTSFVDKYESMETKPDSIKALPSLPPATPSSSYNFWLKYSLVRDGPGLWTFLRQVRASALCILAIETTEGHVLGAFTSQPWRLSKGWYGSKDTFLWKMRRSRLETAGKSIVQQICQESEIQVYPYRTGHVAVQYCSKKCLMLGQGEVIAAPKKHDPEKPRPINVGKHYGYALYLDKNLTSGTTSSSETFGNPCLLDPTQRGAKFTVANIEVWTLTPHTTVADAEQSELSNLFLDGGRDSAHRLNFMNILVGGPI
jgi:TLD